jgi:hypothetical protein
MLADRTVAGNPYQIRFRPHAKQLFPELSAFTPNERPNGKPSLEISTASLDLATSTHARVEYLVFLKRTIHARQQLVTYSKAEGMERLSQVISIGEEIVRVQQRESLLRLLEAPVYELQYHDLEWAEQRLRSLVENSE